MAFGTVIVVLILVMLWVEYVRDNDDNDGGCV